MVIRHINIILTVMLLLIPTLSLAVQLEAVPDRLRVGLEESFTLDLRADGSVDGEPDLSVLEKDFELLGRSQASQIQVINGDISRTTSWNLALLARSAGRKVIPPLCIADDCSAAVTIDVTPPGQGSSSNNAEELLLEVSTESDTALVQSQLLFKVRLLTRLNFLQASLSEPEPAGVEAVVQKLGDDRNYETVHNGLRYRVVERNYAIFPQQSGRLLIPPLRFAAQVAVGGRGGFDPFNQRTRQLRKHSEQISVDVLPAPDSGGRTWLPANDLQLEDEWQQKPPRLTVGEPATRTVTLRASGLPAAQLLPLAIEAPEGVKGYPDQPGREDQMNEDGVTGILQQKLALVPTRPGLLRLPEVRVDWWNLRSGSWQQTVIPAIELEVLPALDSPGVATTPPLEQQPADTAIAPQAEPEEPEEAGDSGFWPWLCLALATGWLITLVLLVRNRSARNRQRQPSSREDETLSLKEAHRELRKALGSGDHGQMRSALLCWGAALFPGQKPRNLEELAALCGNPMQKHLERFNRSLYSRASEPSDVEELIRAAQQTERDISGGKNVEQLPPLYPR